MYVLDINPVALSFMGLEVKWYSIAYIIGILSFFFYCKKFLPLDKKIIDDVFFYGPISIVLGGRIGYVLFYNPKYYFDNIFEVFAIWNGGMAFHGGLVGCIIAAKLISKRHKVSFLKLVDLAACCSPIGLFFGRIANFINGELYGKITDLPWGTVFKDVDYLPRHPSQLYEALGEGVIIFIITNYLLFFTDSLKKNGFISSIFGISYAIVRFGVEFFRVPDWHIGYLAFGLTMGQLLSFPVLFSGLFLFFFSRSGKRLSIRPMLKYFQKDLI